MSKKITNDSLTRSGTGSFITVPIWKQWASKVKQIGQLYVSCHDGVGTWVACPCALPYLTLLHVTSILPPDAESIVCTPH